MKILVVVDVQTYFLNDHTIHLPKAIAECIEAHVFNDVVFFQYVNHPNSNFVKLFAWNHMMHGKEVELASELVPYANKHHTFNKHTFSIFGSDEFVRYLANKKDVELYLCGIDTDACVLASAFAAFEKDHNVKVIEDLCASHHGLKFHQDAIELMKRNIGKVCIVNAVDLKK